jgi:hypothetical protein
MPVARENKLYLCKVQDQQQQAGEWRAQQLKLSYSTLQFSIFPGEWEGV